MPVYRSLSLRRHRRAATSLNYFVLVHIDIELDRPVDNLIVDWPLEAQGGTDPKDLGRGVYGTDDLMRR